ncbi:MAG: hypothetical protein ACQESZ_06725 [Bacteroidota bacterium]
MPANLRDILLTRSSKQEMIRFMEDHPEAFDEALQLSMLNEEQYSWRAAWLVNHSMNKDDARVKSHIEAITDSIPGKSDGHIRELMKILLQMQPGDDEEGKIFDLAISTWEQAGRQPSVRQVAFRLIVKSVEKHPELANEIDFLTEEQYLEPLSEGIKCSVLNMIGHMKKISKNQKDF